MKKLLVIGFALLALTGCGKSNNEKKIDNSNIDINEMPDVKGDENVKVDESGQKTNTSSEFSKEKTYGNYLITDGKLKTDKEGRTTFTAVVKNNSSESLSGGLVDIIFIDSKKNKVSKLPTYIRPLNAGETMNLNASIDKDLSNAYNYYFEQHS